MTEMTMRFRMKSPLRKVFVGCMLLDKYEYPLISCVERFVSVGFEYSTLLQDQDTTYEPNAASTNNI